MQDAFGESKCEIIQSRGPEASTVVDCSSGRNTAYLYSVGRSRPSPRTLKVCGSGRKCRTLRFRSGNAGGDIRGVQRLIGGLSFGRKLRSEPSRSSLYDDLQNLLENAFDYNCGALLDGPTTEKYTCELDHDSATLISESSRGSTFRMIPVSLQICTYNRCDFIEFTSGRQQRQLDEVSAVLRDYNIGQSSSSSLYDDLQDVLGRAFDYNCGALLDGPSTERFSCELSHESATLVSKSRSGNRMTPVSLQICTYNRCEFIEFTSGQERRQLANVNAVLREYNLLK